MGKKTNEFLQRYKDPDKMYKSQQWYINVSHSSNQHINEQYNNHFLPSWLNTQPVEC